MNCYRVLWYISGYDNQRTFLTIQSNRFCSFFGKIIQFRSPGSGVIHSQGVVVGSCEIVDFYCEIFKCNFRCCCCFMYTCSQEMLFQFGPKRGCLLARSHSKLNIYIRKSISKCVLRAEAEFLLIVMIFYPT